MGLEKTFKIFFKSNSWSLASIWSMRYWKYNTVFIIYKTLKEINKTPIECSRKRRECILPGRGHFCSLWTDKFCDKAGKTSKKNLTLEQRWLRNKQMLIRCHEKLNLSFQTYWKDKFQGLQNIKCIPSGHTSRFPPFILMAEKCCETFLRHSRNILYVSIKDEHFFLFI